MGRSEGSFLGRFLGLSLNPLANSPRHLQKQVLRGDLRNDLVFDLDSGFKFRQETRPFKSHQGGTCGNPGLKYYSVHPGKHTIKVFTKPPFRVKNSV